MLRNKWIVLPLILLAFAMFANAGSYTIDVYATLGPNYWGSPSYNGFVDNVVYAMKNSLTSYGSGTAAFNSITSVAPNQPIVSNFQSWQGTAPGAYAGELGTDLYFVLHIVGINAQFSLSQVSWLGTTPDPTSVPYSYTTDNYENDRRGYAGATEYKAGESGTTQVNELIYVGEFMGWQAVVDSGQAGLDSVASYLAGFAGQNITGKYTLWSPAGAAPSVEIGSDQADVQFSGVPEPGTIALAAMGFAAMLFARRKR